MNTRKTAKQLLGAGAILSVLGMLVALTANSFIYVVFLGIMAIVSMVGFKGGDRNEE